MTFNLTCTTRKLLKICLDADAAQLKFTGHQPNVMFI